MTPFVATRSKDKHKAINTLAAAVPIPVKRKKRRRRTGKGVRREKERFLNAELEGQEWPKGQEGQEGKQVKRSGDGYGYASNHSDPDKGKSLMGEHVSTDAHARVSDCSQGITQDSCTNNDNFSDGHDEDDVASTRECGNRGGVPLRSNTSTTHTLARIHRSGARQKTHRRLLY